LPSPYQCFGNLASAAMGKKDGAKKAEVVEEKATLVSNAEVSNAAGE